MVVDLSDQSQGTLRVRQKLVGCASAFPIRRSELAQLICSLHLGCWIGRLCARLGRLEPLNPLVDELRAFIIDNAGADSGHVARTECRNCLLYTSDAADERSSVDLGGRRIIKKK